MIDPEFEKLKKRRLAVVGPESTMGGRQTALADGYVLQGDGLSPADADVDVEALRAKIVAALKTVHDPEIPLNIYDLGLIYGFEASSTGDVHLQMTLTAPGCPVAGALVSEVHEKVRSVPAVRRVKTELVWDPPWSRERMSEAARLELGLL